MFAAVLLGLSVLFAATAASPARSPRAVKGSGEHHGNLVRRAAPVMPANSLQRNGIYLGFLPDSGDSSGDLQLPSSLAASIGAPPAMIGLYSHIFDDAPFDCSELTDIGGSKLSGVFGMGINRTTAAQVPGYTKGALFEDIVRSAPSIFVATVMPMYSFTGLTAANNTQAVRLGQCLKAFTDAGVSVILRYAHEMNWYQSAASPQYDPTLNGAVVYGGTAQDWVESWIATVDTVRNITPSVKTLWCPNNSPSSTINDYWPVNRLDTVDTVGIDFYPRSLDPNAMIAYKSFHDTYATAARPMIVGETGTHLTSLADREQFLLDVTSTATKQALPFLEAINYFNFAKNDGTGVDCFLLLGSSTNNPSCSVPQSVSTPWFVSNGFVPVQPSPSPSAVTTTSTAAVMPQSELANPTLSSAPSTTRAPTAANQDTTMSAKPLQMGAAVGLDGGFGALLAGLALSLFFV